MANISCGKHVVTWIVPVRTVKAYDLNSRLFPQQVPTTMLHTLMKGKQLIVISRVVPYCCIKHLSIILHHFVLSKYSSQSIVTSICLNFKRLLQNLAKQELES